MIQTTNECWSDGWHTHSDRAQLFLQPPFLLLDVCEEGTSQGPTGLEKLQNNFNENILAEYEATRVNKRDTVTVGNLEERQSGLTHIIPP